MRISDWSSDVCSSDLDALQHGVGRQDALPLRRGDAGSGFPSGDLSELDADGGDPGDDPRTPEIEAHRLDEEIGRATCRERVWSVRVDVGGRRLHKKKTNEVHL